MQSSMNKFSHVGVYFDCVHYIFRDRAPPLAISLARSATRHSACVYAAHSNSNMHADHLSSSTIIIAIYLLFIIIAFTN